MDLYFSRRRLFQTSFHASVKSIDGAKKLKEMYRITTTKSKYSIVPETSIIEYVGTDEEKHYTVATIHWRWPSQVSSYIEIGDQMHPLDLFLKREAGWLSTGTHLNFNDEQLTWRSAICRPPQLYDSQGRSIARFIPHSFGLEKTRSKSTVKPGILELSPDVVVDADLRDLAVVSFFVYQACRDGSVLYTPWWSSKEADFSGVVLAN